MCSRRRRDRTRINLERDRISSLPDDVVAKILSFIGPKQAVETSVLSSRWRFIWTKIPYLNFSSEDFSTLDKFHKFFTHVTSSCNNQVEMSLHLHDKGSEVDKDSQVLVQKILDHACSRNLKHLTLIGFDSITPSSKWELSGLRTLHLEDFTLHDGKADKYADLTSSCTNLKSLTIKRCYTGWDSFTIFHPQLSDLTLDWGDNSINVVAPQLKNLTIESWNGELQVFASDLKSMLYKNYRFQLSINIDNLPSLETMDLCISKYKSRDYDRVIDLFHKCSHVKYLTLSLELYELLSQSVEAVAHQPSPFVNLRSLNIYPEILHEAYTRRKFTMFSEIINYLLDSSPGATLTIVTRQEIRSMRYTKSAQNLMAELRTLLDLEDAEIEEDKRLQPLKMPLVITGEKVAQAHNCCWDDLYEVIKQGEEDKRPLKMPLVTGKKAAQVHSCYWDDLNEVIKQEGKKISNITLLLHRIKDLLINVVTSSNKDELLTHYSTLCTKAETVVGKILSRTKIELETMENSFSAYLRQPITSRSYIATRKLEQDTKSAKKLMKELRKLLDKDAELEGDSLLQPLNMPLVEEGADWLHCSYWSGLNEVLKEGEKKISNIISVVHRIKDLRIEDELLKRYSSLCTEADNVVRKILNRTKVDLETRDYSLSVYIRDLFAEAGYSEAGYSS